jgi:uncharacterized alkaline shock family protein YloU
MNLFDRIILILYVLCFIGISVIALLFSTTVLSLEVFRTSISVLYGRIEVTVVAIVIILASLRLLFSGARSNRGAETIVKNDENGIITISFNAIESLVLKVARNVQNVKDVKVKVRKQDGGVSIFLNLTVTDDIIIPELTLDLQENIKSYIESTAGLTVNNIRINVNNIYNPSNKGL